MMLKNKVCVISGGAGLLGSAFSRRCAEEGARVVVVYTNPEKGKALVKELVKKTKNKNIIFVECNITSEESVGGMVKSVVKKFGRIDCLVNSAYPKNKTYGKKFEEVTYESFVENMGMHVGGYFLVSKEVAKVMKKQKSGSIVLIGSHYGVMAPKFEIYDGTTMTMPVEYSAIKGGVIMMAKYMASYLGTAGIRVNSLSPGGVFDNHKDPFLSAYVDKVRIAPKRMAAPNDIANALIFLFSDNASYITGQNLLVDGGWTI